MDNTNNTNNRKDNTNNRNNTNNNTKIQIREWKSSTKIQWIRLIREWKYKRYKR